MLVSVTKADIKDYPYVIILEANAPELEVNDSTFYEISRNVVFPVNQYSIGKNSEVRKELTEDILPRFNNRNYRLDIMNIRGAASPEGPYSWNEILSERRLNSLLPIINDNSNFAMYAPIKTFEVPEDYIYLLRMMKENDDKDYERVAAIVDKYIDSDQKTLKKELMQLD